VSKTQRDKIFTAFKMDPTLRVLLCHPQVMAHGLNLTEADRTIFYGPVFSNNHVSQVIERFNRPGQTRKMTIIQLGASADGVGIYSTVEDQATNQTSMLDLYRNEIMATA
jgi:ERCC4-related helicase